MSRARRIAEIVELLRSLGHESALVGGVAVSIRARERFTKDVDFAVSVASDAEAEALAFGMQRRGFVLRTVVEQEARGVSILSSNSDPTTAVIDRARSASASAQSPAYWSSRRLSASRAALRARIPPTGASTTTAVTSAERTLLRRTFRQVRPAIPMRLARIGTPSA